MAVLGSTAGAGPGSARCWTAGRVTLLALPDVAAVLAVPDVELIAIDMPIGLSDDGAAGLRRPAPAAPGPRAAARCSRHRSAACSPPTTTRRPRESPARGHRPATGAVGAGVPAGQGHPGARRRAGRPAVRPRRRGAPRARVPRPRRRVRDREGQRPRHVQRLRALRRGHGRRATRWPRHRPGSRWSTRSTRARRPGRRGGSPTGAASASATAATDSRGRPMRICW